MLACSSCFSAALTRARSDLYGVAGFMRCSAIIVGRNDMAEVVQRCCSDL